MFHKIEEQLEAQRFLLGAMESRLAQIESHHSATASGLVQIFTLLAELKQENQKQMAQIDDDLALLKTEVANETAVEASASKLISGIGAQVQAAIDKALAAGATPAQLQAITDVTTTLAANDKDLAAAVAANTPAA